MMRVLLCISLCCAMVYTARPQTYLPLTDNMQILSGTSVKIIGGNYSITDSAKNGIIRIINKQNIQIDGDSVTADGLDTTGYIIYIDSSSDITIKNFTSV